MKTTLFTLTFCGLFGFAATAQATPTTVVDLYNACMADGSETQDSTECETLRANINTSIQDCMHPAGAEGTAAKSSHGYKAQYLICSAGARQKFGTSGH